ncbi:hypothetical protein GCM10027447_20740 [Glycomyces halotolerans]
MTSHSKARPIPDDYRRVTPTLVVREAPPRHSARSGAVGRWRPTGPTAACALALTANPAEQAILQRRLGRA